jgi:hypothetical protein
MNGKITYGDQGIYINDNVTGKQNVVYVRGWALQPKGRYHYVVGIRREYATQYLVIYFYDKREDKDGYRRALPGSEHYATALALLDELGILQFI